MTVYEFFAANLGKRVTSTYLEQKFGRGFRSRKSEANKKADAKIEIKNEYEYDEFLGREVSVYFAEEK